MEHIRKTKKKLGVGARGIVYEGYDEERGRFVAIKEIPFFDGGNSCCGSSPSSSHSSSNSPGHNNHSSNNNNNNNNKNNHHNHNHNHNNNGFDHAGVVEEDPVLVEERRAIVREISLMERFEHPNLVAYYGARRSAVGVQIIMEYVNGGSLDALIRRHGSLRESVVRSYTRDILEGLAYLHDTARVCHRDVKPANVLITADGRCKLTDFGVSKLLDDNGTMRTTVGTPWYMAPEVINGTVEEEEIEIEEEEHEEQDDMFACDPNSHHRHTPTKHKRIKRSYTTAADIWSLGVTVFEMIAGRKPFGPEMKSPAAVLFAIAASNGAPPRLPDSCEASPALRVFLDLCFVRDARLRPSARELLSHQWFKESHSASTMASPKRTSIVANNNNNNNTTTTTTTIRRGSSTNNNNNNNSSNSGSRIIDADAPRQRQQQQTQRSQRLPPPPPSSSLQQIRQIQPPQLSSLSMLDTADLINGVMEPRRGPITPLSQRHVRPTQLSSEMISAIAPGKMSFSSVSDSQGGFWSSDGHYVDLVVTSPLPAPPVQKRESK